MECYPLTKPVEKAKGVTQFKIGIVTDLDKLSKGVDEEGEPIWKSLIMTGSLLYDKFNKKVEVVMSGGDEAIVVQSEYSRGMRGMELSELIVYNGGIYSIDDRTGIVFDVGEGKAVPWVILADGSGKETKGFKGEWMTRKGGKLYVGGHGREFVSDDEKRIIHRNYQWIKIIEKSGAVKHINWQKNFDSIREKVGYPYPGYLIHESCVWSDVHRQWFFLPRKVSSEPYDADLDNRRAGNLLIRCSEDFCSIEFIKIGELKYNTRGFSSFKFVPGTEDTVMVALKSEETEREQKSFVTVFTIDGEILLEDQHLADMKYEGIEFI